MGLSELLRWQWQGYPRYHASKFNLLLHLVAVPMFLAGNLVVISATLHMRWPAVVAGLVAMVVSLILQGRGHAMEATPSEPFTSPLNAISRLLVEQWISFPRFVMTGGWARAMAAPRDAGPPQG